jgi:hypothetical protein
MNRANATGAAGSKRRRSDVCSRATSRSTRREATARRLAGRAYGIMGLDLVRKRVERANPPCQAITARSSQSGTEKWRQKRRYR